MSHPVFYFGVVQEKPRLPKGFVILESEDRFLRAQRECDGKEFYVAEEGLYPVKRVRRRDVKRTRRMMVLGCYYADTNKRHKIRI